MPTVISSDLHRLRVFLWRCLVAGSLFVVAAAWAQTNAPAPALLLTNFAQMWALSGEAAQQPQHLRTEVVIYFYDMDWTVAFGLSGGSFSYLPIGSSKLPLKTGQHILIDGLVIPAREVFSWDKTQVKVLEESVSLPVTTVASLRTNASEIAGRLVVAEGLIDQCGKQDDSHWQLNFLVNGDSAIAFVHLHATNQPFPFKQGDFVRLKCLDVPTFDRDGNLHEMAIWVDGAENVHKTGSLAEDGRFLMPATTADQLGVASYHSALQRVTGEVRANEAGKWVTIWDDTGEVMIQSAQTQNLRLGDRIEAVGSYNEIGVRHILRSALYRLVETNKIPLVSEHLSNAPIRLAAQIQSLSQEEVSRHPPVKLRAIVVWSAPAAPFIYVQDSSGCVRVANPRFKDTNVSDGTILDVSGQVAAGAYVPIVTNALASRGGWATPDAAEPITLDQALSGAAEGRFVEMRAYVRSASVEKDLTLLQLSTSRGEFRAWVPNQLQASSLVGSVVRIRGICAGTSNERHQLTGVELWVPLLGENVQIEEKAPEDLFASPLRSLGSLRRFNSHTDINQRVRTAGTVVLHEPGRYLYVQDGKDSILALSQQEDPLQPGDHVEVVGFPGTGSRSFLLREAVYRRVKRDIQPIPIPLPARHVVNPDLEGLLARSRGTLLDAVQKDNEARLLVQSDGYTFEARLDSPNALNSGGMKKLPLNSKINVTGVYEVQGDEYGHPATFCLHLRSWDDAVLLEAASWWTSSRLLVLLLVVVIGTVLAVAWGLYNSQKNALLHRAQNELKLANARLEDRVLSRTCELSEQVKVKEQALSELAHAQQRLILASRQAGMAEVATGVLHNVGNVLNSVNVSASCLRDRVQHLQVEYIGQTAALLSQAEDRLASFLTDDPRGRSVPGFLAKLGQSLVQEKLELKDELESLAKNVEHINTIVSMQQNHAKIGGVLEKLEVKSLLEDTIQIHRDAYDRHAIELVCDWQIVPPVLVDRHKVMQILINLLGNAKYALENRSSGKRVTVSLFAPVQGRVRVTVADNGCGIAKENLHRIFSQGFTTRKKGHGFGLHNGALAAVELGGSLSVQSEGPGLGATFTLEFPSRPQDMKQETELVRKSSVNPPL